MGLSKTTLDEIRDAIERCRNTDNDGCIALTSYRDQANVNGASHPILFQVVSDARIIIIGAIPGSIGANAGKAAYQKLVNGQFSLGHKSAQGLGEIMMRVGHLKKIILPTEITSLPDTKYIQEDHLRARERLGLHVTNLVKCPAPTGWESNQSATWKATSYACKVRHLAEEIRIVDPSMVILLGKEVADYFSVSESWDLEGNKLRISNWADHAGYLPFYGKSRFVTAWIHPGGRYYWMQGQQYWNLYAKQMAEFVD